MARQMKDSGIEWIGEIPETWETSRVGLHYSIILGKMLCPNQVSENYTLEPYFCAADVHFDGVSTEGLKQMWFSADEKEAYIVHNGDLLVVEGGAGAGGCAIARNMPRATYIQNSIMIVRKKNGDNRFLRYLIEMLVKRGYIDIVCNKATIPHFTKDKLANVPLPILSDNEMSSIADFLDRKCAEIDAVIERTKATIEEYKKLKQAVITEAVTKGVRGPRPMKDSGIEWIGEMCDTYKVYRLKHLVNESLMYGANESGIPYDANLPRYIRITDITLDGHLKDDGKLSLSESAAEPYILKNNDILFARSGATVGKAFIYKQEYGKAAFAGYLIKASTNELVCADYVFYYTQSSLYEEWKKQIFVQATIQNIGADRYNNLPVVLPSVEEQREIIAFLDEKCSALDTLIANKTALLTELETYKKSLIYEYVTGKRECPEAVEQATAAGEYPYFPAAVSTKKLRFAQAMMMAKVLDMHGKGMGRVKLEKMLYTIETSIGFDFDTDYVREAAGPLHESIYKCEGIISRQNHWYQLHQSQYGVSYTPTQDAGKYRAYYDKYFSSYNAEIERIINIFKPYSTDQAEIVATLFAAWNDAIIDRKSYTDEDIVDDVLNNWHDNKKRFPKDVWLRAMEQMRKNNLIPKGYGKHTVTKAAEM